MGGTLAVAVRSCVHECVNHRFLRPQSRGSDAVPCLTTDQTVDVETQTVVIGLTGPGGGTVCGEACGLVPVTGEARLSSVIVTVPTVEGWWCRPPRW